jgi:photosystem II stability/assembly factor-like uncharacterized protein
MSGFNSIFGTSDGKYLWVGGRINDKGTVLESDDGGEHWKANGAPNPGITEISGTRDGQRPWAVGNDGRILKGAVQ